MRILFVKTSSLGDVIHNLPVVNDILLHHPHALIDWVVEENFADIPRMHPNVHHVLPIAIRRWRKQLWKQQCWREIGQFLNQLQSQPYDVIIDTQGLIKSGCLARLARGVTHGYDRHSIREPWASVCYQHTYRIPYQQAAVTRNRTLAARSLHYPVPDNMPDYGLIASAHTPKLNATQTPKIQRPVNTARTAMAFHATSRDSKLWPEQEWVALGQALESHNIGLLLPWANPSEFERATRIASSLRLATVLPKLGISALAKVIAQADMAIGVDTGLSHLATALDVPTVAIYTDTDPALTGVMRGPRAQAINLGGVGNPPCYQQVLTSLASITTRVALDTNVFCQIATD